MQYITGAAGQFLVVVFFFCFILVKPLQICTQIKCTYKKVTICRKPSTVFHLISEWFYKMEC